MATAFDYQRAFGRSDGLLTSVQQKKLQRTVVAIAGCGGDGGLLAERLARAGVGELRLADPESFDTENTNRQFAAACDTMGRNKAKVVAEAVRLINPEIVIGLYSEGITEDNVGDFVDGAAIVVDEIEYSLPEVSLMLSREARRAGIPSIVGANVGFGANVFALNPTGRTLEEHYLASGGALGEGAKGAIGQARALCPRVPSYVEWGDLVEVMRGQRPVPSVSQAVAAVAAVVSQEVVNYVCGIRDLVWVPQYIELDLLRRTMRVRRATAWGFYASLVRCRATSVNRGARAFIRRA